MRWDIFLPIGLLISLLVSSCGDNSTRDMLSAAQTECPAHAANIRVGDGYLQRDCGCQEAGKGVIFTGSNLLQCTVTRGTAVFFHFTGTHLLHQIISTGDRTFPSSPLSNPADNSQMIRDHAVVFAEPGSYSFIDAHGGLSGTIIVQ